jgi:hypothetical protein
MATSTAPISRLRKVSPFGRDLRVGDHYQQRLAERLVRNAEPHALAVFLNQMRRLARDSLLVSSDFRRALPCAVTGGTRFPHSMAFSAANDLPHEVLKDSSPREKPAHSGSIDLRARRRRQQ